MIYREKDIKFSVVISMILIKILGNQIKVILTSYQL